MNKIIANEALLSEVCSLLAEGMQVRLAAKGTPPCGWAGADRNYDTMLKSIAYGRKCPPGEKQLKVK